jgi:hypothetical protein
MGDYIVETLSGNSIGEAFPLMHLVMPKLDLQAWQHFARFALDSRRGRLAGILIARRTARRHICGLVCYRLEADFSSGRFIQARNLIGIDILDPRPIISVLISKLARVAQANGCTAVHVSIPEGEVAASHLPDLLIRHELQNRVQQIMNVEFLMKDLVSIEDEETGIAH